MGQWSAEQHAAHLGDPAFRYFVVDAHDGQLAGFAALHVQVDSLLLNRIIVGDAGRGLGGAMLSDIITLAPSLGPCSRIWLRVAAHNDQAIRLYQSFGFEEEKRLSAAGTLPDGRVVDLIVMARILVPEA